MTAVAKPNVRQTLLVLQQLLKDKKFGRAETIALHLQASYPRRADANDALGCILAAMRKFRRAEPYCRRALQIEPGNPLYSLNLGRILLELGSIVEAEPLLTRALQIDPKLHLAAWALGTFYFTIGRGDRAIGYYRRAMSLAPAPMLPWIRYELANCLLSMGMAAEAGKELQNNLMPGLFRAKSVATLAGLGRHNADAREYAMVEAELQRQDLTVNERSSLLLRKGVMLENSGRFTDSFDTIREAKRILRINPDVAAFGKDVDERIEVFTAGRIERLAELYGHPSRRHVFIVGMPRSGTTLTEQIVVAHSQAGGAGELKAMEILSDWVRNGGSLLDIEAELSAVGPDKIRHMAQDYVATVDYLAPGKKLIADKMPHNFQLIGEIAVLFPHAKIVHCARHPADSFLSAFQNDMTAAHSYSFSVETYAEYYAAYARLMRHWYEALPGRIFTVQYEKLTTDPRTVIGRLLQFLGLEWEEECLNFHQNKSTVNTLSMLQVRSPINTGSVGRWKNYERQVEPLIRRFGSEPPFGG